MINEPSNRVIKEWIKIFFVLALIGGIGESIDRLRKVDAQARAGHEAIYAQVAAELSTAQRGDIIVLHTLQKEDVAIVQYNSGVGGEAYLICRIMDGRLEQMRLPVSDRFFVEHHAQLIHAGTAEYGQKLGQYFAHLYDRE